MQVVADSRTSEVAAPSLEPGTVISQRYRIESVIASGGMGTVYLGRHLRLDHEVAIKTLRPSLSRSMEAVARFVGEAKLLSRLRIRGVPRVSDLGRTGSGLLYMVQELVLGEDLRTRSHRQPLNQRAILVVGAQLAAILDSVHRQGVVHRDVKPENVLIGHDGQVSLVDFGIAKFRSTRAMTFIGERLGSPDYMAPEQLRAPARVDLRADIWSLGALMYEQLLRDDVLQETIVGELWDLARLEQAERVLFQRRPDVSLDLWSIVKRCLQPDSSQRFASAAELQRVLIATAAAHRARTMKCATQAPPVAKRDDTVCASGVHVGMDLPGGHRKPVGIV